MRGKYAPPSRGRRKMKNVHGEEEFLDQKTSKKIFDMTKDQQHQMAMEEHVERQRRQAREIQGIVDSDDENVEIEELEIEEEEE